MNSEIRLDLFKLHDKKDNVNSWILAKGENLEEGLKKLIEKTSFSNTELVKHLMKKLDISITTSERLVYLKREWYPLVFIEELVNLTNSSKYEIQGKVDFLKSTKPPIVEYRAVKHLTINLCKIAGAHAADGTLRDSYIAITDQYKNNIIALRGWFREFDYFPKLRKVGKNEYGIVFSSKIISRYLTKLFGFPSGCKQYTVKEPRIIKESKLEFRKAFALGALTFEAGIGMKNQIEFCVSSRQFRDSIVCILNELNIKNKSMEKQSSDYWRFWSNTLTKNDAIEWIELFEPNTEKWFKLNDYIYGFSKKVHSFEEATQVLNLVYSKKPGNKITMTDVLLAIKELKQTHRYELVEYLIKKNNLGSYGGKWAHSIKHYLDILKRANIVSIEKRRFGKKKSFGTIVREIYIFNEDISKWVVPNR